MVDVALQQDAGVPVLVHWRLTFDLVQDRLWISPSDR